MRYVVDVTQLVHWPGNLTGIPRVMDELAIRFAKIEADKTIFVSWVKEVGAMCEVDFVSTREHRGKGIDYIKKSSNSQQVVASPAPSSRSTQRFAKRVVKKLAKTTRLDQTSLYNKALDSARSAEFSTYKVYGPIKGDKFFIPWGEWWDQNWLNLVKGFRNQSVEIYTICHDILPMIVPQFSGNSSSLAEFVEQIFPISATVLTVSESTKRDLMAWMNSKNLTVPPIQTFRLGEDFTVKKSSLKDEDVEKKYAIKSGEYTMFVSTIEPRKNHAILYYAYKLAKAKGITLPKLLIVGRVGHDVSEIIKLITEDPDVNESISIQNNVDDNDLNWLYEHCAFSIMPSFYEGWGMSVVESISRGKPVVCSNTSSLQEMPKDSVLFFSPASTDECLAAIAEMMKPDTLKRLRESAKSYKTHSWDASFAQVIGILE